MRDLEEKTEVNYFCEQPFLYCPQGHRVFLRVWNSGSDLSRDIRQGRKCLECDKVYDLEDLSRD